MSREIVKALPARKIGELADIVDTAIYFWPRASSYVCGHTAVLDGGKVINAG
jgi:NAD(P)-dependent dehydrogenase (short-subunit alcohol dehydrogenase family)